MEIIRGRIEDYGADGSVYIRAIIPDIGRACLRKYDEVQVGLPDGRRITPEQRRKAYALMREIAEWMGDLPEYVKRLMKMEFMVTRMQALEKHIFSLSDCDMTTAREFITYLIDFIIEHDVPTQTPLIELCEDIGRYVYACLMHKKCAVCGANHVDLHHTQAVGAGRNRDDILQLGMPVLPLCREHHMESHNIGQKSFMEKYHLQAIELTKEIGKVYKLSRKNVGDK